MGEKEKRWVLVGLGLIVIGCIWFVLSIAAWLGGMAWMFGYFLGPGLACAGLLVASVYLYRSQRIRRLLEGQDVLAKWADGPSQTIIAATGAYVDDELYLWGTPGTRLEEVRVEGPAPAGAGDSYLRITFGEASSAHSPVTGSRLWRKRSLSVRIPQGQERTAEMVLQRLQSRLASS